MFGLALHPYYTFVDEHREPKVCITRDCDDSSGMGKVWYLYNIITSDETYVRYEWCENKSHAIHFTEKDADDILEEHFNIKTKAYLSKF